MSARTRSASRSDLGRLALAALLGAMAAGQLSDPSGFFGILETYRVGGASTATASAMALMAGELAAAGGLLSRTRSTQHVGAQVALIVAVVWSVLGFQAFARGLRLESCGCRGRQPARSSAGVSSTRSAFRPSSRTTCSKATVATEAVPEKCPRGGIEMSTELIGVIGEARDRERSAG